MSRPLSIIVLLSLILVLASAPAIAQNRVTEIYNQGNASYQAGDFDQAIKHYQAAVATGLVNHALYYNLGNSYFKTGDLGHAILNYERGLKLAPGNEDLRFNLEFARLSTIDKIDQLEKTFLQTLLENALNSVSLSAAVNLAIWLYLALCTCGLLAVLWRRKNGRLSITLWIGGVLLILSVLIGPLVYMKAHRDVLAVEGVVLAQRVKVMSGPGEGYSTVFTIHEGMHLSVREVRGGWAQITIPSGFSGWLPVSTFEKI